MPITTEQIIESYSDIDILQSRFIAWYHNVFKTDPLYTAMANEVEDSPYHRENNVGVHTDMVVTQYLCRCEITPDTINGAFAAAFHDVGKPPSKETRHSEERGEYRAYNGHEQLSARLWETYAAKNWHDLQQLFGFVASDIYIIGWMIEHHLPWGVKKVDKVKQLVATVKTFSSAEEFCGLLMADTLGRVSDPGNSRHATGEQWSVDFSSKVDALEVRDNPVDVTDIHQTEKLMFVPIGASGSGKSTFFLECDGNNIKQFSMDLLRIDWYDADDYATAWQMSCDDGEFRQKTHKAFMELLATNPDVLYIDNLNLSKKSRGFYINTAKQRGYTVVALLMPADVDTLIERQNTRTDKYLDPVVVTRQYMGVHYPSIGEVDVVISLSANLP